MRTSQYLPARADWMRPSNAPYVMTSFVHSLPFWLFLLTVGVFAVAAALLLLIDKLVVEYEKQMAARPPSRHVGFATDGDVELQGEVQAINGRTLKTPLSGTDCVWYRARLDKFKRGDDPGDDYWACVRDVYSRDPFLLKDRTGACLVFPKGARISYTDRSIWFGPTPVPSDKTPLRMLPGEAVDDRARPRYDPEAQYRYTEERIYAGDRMFAVGQLTTAPWGKDEAAILDRFRPPDAAPVEETPYHFFAVSLELPGTPEDAFAEGTGPIWDPREREADMLRQAANVTWRRLVRVWGRPYRLSTQPEPEVSDKPQRQPELARRLAFVLAAVAGLLVWLRYS